MSQFQLIIPAHVSDKNLPGFVTLLLPLFLCVFMIIHSDIINLSIFINIYALRRRDSQNFPKSDDFALEFKL